MEIIVDMGFTEDLIQALNNGLQNQYDGKYSHLAKAAGVHATTVKKILGGERTKWIGVLGQIADAAGLQVTQVNEGSSEEDVQLDKKRERESLDTCDMKTIPQVGFDEVLRFIDSQISSNQESYTSMLLKYIQVPENNEYIRYRHSLVALELPANSTSMSPSLNPGDLLIVDIHDRIPQSPPGNIYLVRDPATGKAMIRRVGNTHKNGHDYLVYYTDNTLATPEMINIDKELAGRLENALKGRVVAAFCNMSIK